MIQVHPELLKQFGHLTAFIFGFISYKSNPRKEAAITYRKFEDEAAIKRVSLNTSLKKLTEAGLLKVARDYIGTTSRTFTITEKGKKYC